MPAQTVSWSVSTDSELLSAKSKLENTLSKMEEDTTQQYREMIIETCKTHIGYINDELSKRGI